MKVLFHYTRICGVRNLVLAVVLVQVSPLVHRMDSLLRLILILD